MKGSILFAGCLCGILLSGLAAPVCRADTVFLTDGREVNGTILNEDQQTVVIKTTHGATRSIRRADIDTIVREKSRVAEKEKDPPRTLPASRPAVDSVVNGRPVAPVVRPAPGTAAPDSVRTAPPAVSIAVPGDNGSPPPARVGITPATSTRDTSRGTENPMPGFPENAKRVSGRKEALLSDALETIKVAYKNPEDPAYEAALNDIQALNSDACPYLWAGIQNENAEVRTACMKLIGKLNCRTCVKRAIETFYMTMPEQSAAATWNVPFVDETIKTVATITGQRFITVEARRLGVQDGLKKYVDWYNANWRNLPRQVGEPDLDPNDKDYDAKLADLRALKLTKREWPHSDALPADLVAGPNKTGPEKAPTPVIKDAEREVDKKFSETVATVPEDKALKRPIDPPGAPDDLDALKRGIDRRIEKVPGAPQNQRRDPPSDEPSQNSDLPEDPLKRPQDLRKERP